MRSRLLRWAPLALGTAALGVCLWFTPGLWTRFDGWVQDQRDALWSKLEDAVGRKVVYQRIAPNVLSALDFQNVRILADDGSPLFSAGSVRFSWDWSLLFQGRFAEALRRIQVINGTLDLDSRRDGALLARWQESFRPQGTGASGPALGFEVEGFNLSARWTDGTKTLAVDRAFVLLAPEAGHWGLRFRGTLAAADPASKASLRMAVRGDLRSDLSFQNLSLRAEASEVSTTWFDLAPLTVQVAVDPASITLAKVADQIPLDLQAVWDRATGQWRFRGAAQDFRPSRLVRWKGDRVWAGVAEGTVTGRFEYRLGGDFLFSGQASWPSGALPAPFGDGSLAASGTIGTGGGRLWMTGLRVETPVLSAGFDGSLDLRDPLPEGTLQLDRWTPGPEGEARGTVRLTRTGNRLDFQGDGWTWNSLGSRSPSGWVEREGASWRFRLEGPVDRTAEGRFSTEGTLVPGEGRVEASVSLGALPLEVLRDEAGRWIPDLDLPPDLWALEAGTEARFFWSAEGPQLFPSAFEFRDPSRPGREIRGTAAWKGRHGDLDLGTLRWDGLEASLAFGADFADDGAVDGTLAGRLWDRPLSLAGRWVSSDRTLVFSGAPGIRGLVHGDARGIWTAEGSLEPLEIVPGLILGFEARAVIDGGDWELEARQVSVSGKYPWNQEAFQSRARLRLDPTVLRLDGLVLEDGHGSLAGSLASSWSADFSLPWSGRLSLATPGTSAESAEVHWVVSAPDRWRLAGRTAGLDITRSGFTALKGVQGRLTASGTADWSGTDGTWSAQAALSEARWGDAPLGLRASLSGTASRLSVRGLNLAVNPIRIVDGSLDLDAGARTWTAALGVGLRLGAGDWESRWATGGTWTSAGEPLRITASLAASANTWSRRAFPDWGLQATWTGTGWEAATADGGVRAQGRNDGAFSVLAQAPFPVAADARGTWDGASLELLVRGVRADLDLVKPFVNSPAFSINGGRVEGDFRISGVLSDPEVTGQLLCRGFSAASSYVRRPIGPVDVPVVLTGRQVRIDPVNAGPPGQTWMVSGLARLDHLLPEEYQITIQTDPLSPIPAAYLGTGIAASGSATGTFWIKGTPQTIGIGGRLVLQDTVITLKDQGPAGPPAAEALGVNADLTLVTGRKVEFLWPNESLPLLRAVTASGQTLVIKANDVASTWSLTGKLALRTGEISYLNRTFVVREGQLGFQENQNSFDPRLAVRAEYKVQETSGPVVINLRADGTLGRFSPRFDAVPYKSPEELQQLVGTTLAIPTDYTKANNAEAALSVASDIGTSFLLTPFEEAVKKNFGLDLFTVKTEILKKSLLGRNGPLEASDYLDNTRLFFGKYIGDDLFLQGTLAFRRDGTAATQVSPKMVFEPEIQMEFQTPFFLLDWTLVPQHPETLFVTDNTVTFRWNWSY